MDQIAQDKGPTGLSIAALITDLLGMTIIPIILGGVNLGRIKIALQVPEAEVWI